MYKNDMERLKINWIGLKLGPPLLFSLSEGRKEEDEIRKWEEIETWRVLSSIGNSINKGLRCQRDHQSYEGYGYRLSFSEDEQHLQ